MITRWYLSIQWWCWKGAIHWSTRQKQSPLYLLQCWHCTLANDLTNVIFPFFVDQKNPSKAGFCFSCWCLLVNWMFGSPLSACLLFRFRHLLFCCFAYSSLFQAFVASCRHWMVEGLRAAKTMPLSLCLLFFGRPGGEALLPPIRKRHHNMFSSKPFSMQSIDTSKT